MTTVQSCTYNKNFKCWSHIWLYRKGLQSAYTVMLNSYDKSRTCHVLAFCADYDIFFLSICLPWTICLHKTLSFYLSLDCRTKKTQHHSNVRLWYKK